MPSRGCDSTGIQKTDGDARGTFDRCSADLARTVGQIPKVLQDAIRLVEMDRVQKHRRDQQKAGHRAVTEVVFGESVAAQADVKALVCLFASQPDASRDEREDVELLLARSLVE